MAFANCYDDARRAEAYSTLQFRRTYLLAYRDLPEIFARNVRGRSALDFGCGTGRSTRFLRELDFEAVGIDIAANMVAKARELDPGGDYRVIPNGDFRQFPAASFDLVLAAFTFDNIPGAQKVELFTGLGRLLKPEGVLVSIVSNPEIYWHEWASFSTKDFPENRAAKSGDLVRIITTEIPDARPTEDILWTDEAYREVYARAGLRVLEMHKPLASGTEPEQWVSETRVAPWVIYVLGPPSAG
jgi:SAM-dependent methyltransferase